jgi:late competence protein required for DNA uptake (superfamily II DNA/RNA helicase)
MEERCMMVEVLEKAFEKYEREKQVQAEKGLEKYIRVIEPKPKKVISHPNKNFTCDKCGEEFQRETAYSYVASLTKFARTYCRDCIERGKL